MVFHDAWVIFLIPILFIGVYLLKKKKTNSSFRYSSLMLLDGSRESLKCKISKKMVYVRCLALALMLLALARPQSPVKETIKRAEGIDIILAIDASKTMLAEDFSEGSKKQSRIDAVKKVIPDFVNERPNDRIGAVIFASRAYILCPPTLNHKWLLDNVSAVKAGYLGNKTAIGSAVVASLNRLKKQKSKSKVIVLLTDGRNNAGEISPETAAEMARAMNIKIYAIGAGSASKASFPVYSADGKITGYEDVKLDLDENLLRGMADRTGAKYFRATDKNSLGNIYTQIDRLEKTVSEEKLYNEYNELFMVFLIPGLIILFIEVFLSNTIFLRIP